MENVSVLQRRYNRSALSPSLDRHGFCLSHSPQSPWSVVTYSGNQVVIYIVLSIPTWWTSEGATVMAINTLGLLFILTLSSCSITIFLIILALVSAMFRENICLSLINSHFRDLVSLLCKIRSWYFISFMALVSVNVYYCTFRKTKKRHDWPPPVPIIDSMSV